MVVTLRSVVSSDLSTFYEQQADPDAIWMAAFNPPELPGRDAFASRWARLLESGRITPRTVLADGAIAGSILSYEEDGRREVSYWLGRAFWGRGIATAALAAFLKVETTRPIYARVAVDNAASLRVLEKNGFVVTRQERGFAEARGEEIDELVLVLPGETRGTGADSSEKGER